MGLLHLIRMRRRNGSIQSSLLLFGVVFTQSLAGQSLSLPASPKASDPITEMLADTLSKSEIPPALRSIGQNHSMGWGVSAQPWSEGPVLGHSGSNIMWYSTIFVAPKEQVVYLVAANIANSETSHELNRAIQQLIETRRDQRSE